MLTTAATLLTAGGLAIASPASASYCVHSDHWHGSLYYDYRSHHTHSWGDHHHVVNVFQGGTNFLGQVHAAC